MDVGVRELDTKLSEYPAAVAAGDDVVITDHGRPVARLVPFESSSMVDRGIAEGWIEAFERTRLDPVERHRSSASVLDVLGEDRG